MTLDEFTFHFDRLSKAFSVSKPRERAEIYFEKTRGIDRDIFSKACDYILEKEEKFPTVARLLAKCEELHPPTKNSKQECNICDGYGNVMIAGVAYRGSCKHGDALSKQIKVAPITYIGQQSEAIRQNNEWMKVYGYPRREAKHLQNVVTGKYPHWWIEQEVKAGNHD